MLSNPAHANAPALQLQLFKEAVKSLEAVFDECSRVKEREKASTASGISLNPLSTTLATVKSMANSVEQATALLQAAIEAFISQILYFFCVFDEGTIVLHVLVAFYASYIYIYICYGHATCHDHQVHVSHSYCI